MSGHGGKRGSFGLLNRREVASNDCDGWGRGACQVGVMSRKQDRATLRFQDGSQNGLGRSAFRRNCTVEVLQMNWGVVRAEQIVILRCLASSTDAMAKRQNRSWRTKEIR